MATTLPLRSNVDLIEANYELWKKDPNSVNSSWSAFFEGFELGSLLQKAPSVGSSDGVWQSKVDQLVQSYWSVGHTKAHLNPLAAQAPEAPLLTLEALGFESKDLQRTVSTPLFQGGKSLSLRELIEGLENIYCRHIGIEFAHIQNPKVREWVRTRFEARMTQGGISAETEKRMLRQVLSVESFEKFLHTRFVGQKRFSIEGGESLMVALYAVFESCPEHAVEELVMGMAHQAG